MLLDIKYNPESKQIICKDLHSGIVGKVIRVKNDDEAYRIMADIDCRAIVNHIKEIQMKGVII